MRHLPGYKQETCYEAALYCVDNDFNYDEALRWIDKAIEEGERFENLDLKAQILGRLGRTGEAATLQANALKVADPAQLYGYGERLLREKRLQQASDFFTKATNDHPSEWLNWYGLARVQVALGDRAAAKRSLDKALAAASRPDQKAGMRRMLERLAAGQGID